MNTTVKSTLAIIAATILIGVVVTTAATPATIITKTISSITTIKPAYATSDKEHPTKPDKYCYTVIYPEGDTDLNCYPKKKECEQNRPTTHDEDTTITECTKLPK